MWAAMLQDVILLLVVVVEFLASTTTATTAMRMLTNLQAPKLANLHAALLT